MKQHLIRLLAFALAAILAVSCIPKLDPEYQSSGTAKADPTTDGTITFTLTLDSNISQYVNVFFTIGGFDRYTRTGSFKNTNTVSVTIPSREATSTLAVYAEQIRDVPPRIFNAEDGITFSVNCTVRTPGDGLSLTWSGLHGAPLKSNDEIKTYVIEPVNTTSKYADPKGTGRSQYIQFTVAHGKDGKYFTKADWLEGNIIDR